MSESVLITRLASRGDGVTADGRHLPGTAPGDLVDMDGALVERGPHHQAPVCAYFGRCGGCQLQHVDDAAYAGFIRDRIAQALASQGLEIPELAPVHLSPPASRRRASLRATRSGKRITIGFNEGESHQIIDIGQCPVLDPTLVALLAPLRELLPTLIEDRKAAVVTMTLCDQGVDLMIGPLEIDNYRALEAMNDFASAHGLARLSVDSGYGAEPVHMPEHPTISFGGIPVRLPAGAFLQATPDGEAALRRAVETIVSGRKRIADLFAGLGTFALPLSAAAHVTAIDAAGAAIAALGEAAGRARRPLVARHRDLFRAPLDVIELNGFDAVVVDPPRAGARNQAQMLARSKVPSIAMVSCNPSSFARDAKTLIDGGYHMRKLWPVGQFRWSTHVELVAWFER